ncbi:A1pp-domain-containing protein [Zychaea mexicana]|uniref:A1pp-domain-containing protein n=1 Tax=Zychaea mexicana TaxID=64656 RepID=UPI0022FE5DDE|nr:A1pp-domain-containing protein [Zychaea mexicana]KAI9496086.1 A1pp-domain-containing protein [Zychaea mexicana]
MASIAERGLAQLKALYASEAAQLNQEAVRKLSNKLGLSAQDITKLDVDAIVNAANNSLLGGGGVDGAIHAAAGPQLVEECRPLGGCKDGDAKITKGYKLPAKHVIHTVGPQSEKKNVLISCYQRCLEVLVDNGLRSIAFPCVATGVYGYDKERGANVALGTVRRFLEKNPEKIDKVIFCLFNAKDKKIYQELLPVYFPESDISF